MPSTNRLPVLACVVTLALVLGVVHAMRSYLPLLLDFPIRTVSAAVLALNVVGYLLAPLAILGIAYWAGTRADVPREYGTIALQFGVLAAVCYPVGFAVVALVAAGNGDLLRFAVSVGLRALIQGTWFAVAGVAGAAVAHFRERNA